MDEASFRTFVALKPLILLLFQEINYNSSSFEIMYYLCSTDEMPRKHIKAECSNKNGWQLVTSKSDNPPNVLIIKG